MLGMNFPDRKEKRRKEAEARNAKTPFERTKKARQLAAVKEGGRNDSNV